MGDESYFNNSETHKESSNLNLKMVLMKIDSMKELIEERLSHTNKDIEEVKKELSKYACSSQENSITIHEIRTKIFSDTNDAKEKYKLIEDQFADIQERIDNIESKLDINDGKEFSNKRFIYVFAIIAGLISVAASLFSSIISKFIGL